MNYEQFSTIYKALKSISTGNSLNKDAVIEQMKKLLSQDSGEYQDSDAYKEWEKGKFSLDHVFITEGYQPENTLLIRACNSADLEVVDCLLRVGADVNVAAGDKNPFTVAIESEWDGSKKDAKAIVDLLMKKVNTHVGTAGENNTMVKAVERGNLRVFEALIKAGASPDIEAHGTTLLKWAKTHQPDPKINKEDMEKIINTLKAPSEEKRQTGPGSTTEVKEPVSSEISPDNVVSNDSSKDAEQDNSDSNVNPAEDNVSQEERDEELAFKLQCEEIALSDGGQLPENNGAILPDDEKEDTVNAATTSVNGSNTSPTPSDLPASVVTVNTNCVDDTISDTKPIAGNKTPEKNGTTFWSEHKGKIALAAAVVCAAGAVAAYVLAYPAVALALTVLATVILMGAGIAKVLEDPSVEKPFTQREVH